jgi:hypothetical protein
LLHQHLLLTTAVAAVATHKRTFAMVFISLAGLAVMQLTAAPWRVELQNGSVETVVWLRI